MSETNRNGIIPKSDPKGVWTWQSDFKQRLIIVVIAALLSSLLTNGVWVFTINHRLTTVEQDVRELRNVMYQHLNAHHNEE